jgi:hypothetical protein
MQHYVNDNAKRRLIERVDIETAIDILRSRGYRTEELVVQMTRIFYVDLDAVNEVLSSSRSYGALR